jgi:hypothetical protein
MACFASYDIPMAIVHVIGFLFDYTPRSLDFVADFNKLKDSSSLHLMQQLEHRLYPEDLYGNA